MEKCSARASRWAWMEGGLSSLSHEGRGSSGQKHRSVLEDPGVSNRPAGDPNDVYASFVQHADDVFCGENVAAAEDCFVGPARLDPPQDIPAAAAEVFLFDGSRVNAHGGIAVGPDGFHDLLEAILGLRRLIEAAAEADRRDGARGERVAHRFDDRNRPRHIHQHVPASGFVFDLLHGAGKVEVDDVITCLLKQAGRFRHGVRLGADDLTGGGMIFVVDVD